MIDPLRPYWPTNRSIAGLLVRSACLLAAGLPVIFGSSRTFTLLVVAAAGLVQALLLVFEWMELKRTHRSGLAATGVIVFLLLSLVAVLFIESRWVLVGTVR